MVPIGVSAAVVHDGIDVVLRGEDGDLFSLRCDGTTWSEPVRIGGGATGNPGLVVDNFVVPSGDRLVHYRRSGTWTEQGALPADSVGRRPIGVGAIDSSFGNVELVAAFDDGVLLPYYLNSENDTWMSLPALADGQRVFGDLGIWEAVARQKFAAHHSR